MIYSMIEVAIVPGILTHRVITGHYTLHTCSTSTPTALQSSQPPLQRAAERAMFCINVQHDWHPIAHPHQHQCIRHSILTGIQTNLHLGWELSSLCALNEKRRTRNAQRMPDNGVRQRGTKRQRRPHRTQPKTENLTKTASKGASWLYWGAKRLRN